MFHVEHGVRMFHVEQIVLPVGEVGDGIVPGLSLGLREIDGAAEETGWGACLEATEFQAEFLQGA